MVTFVLDKEVTYVPISRMTTHELIAAIEQYGLRAGIAPATVTGRAVGNSRLYQRMKGGGSCTVDVAERLLIFFQTNPPTQPADPASNIEHSHASTSQDS